jgi:hypothetical protein
MNELILTSIYEKILKKPNKKVNEIQEITGTRIEHARQNTKRPLWAKKLSLDVDILKGFYDFIQVYRTLKALKILNEHIDPLSI